ncbi:putative LRR receptor-like serine/threonine-protein kinase [Forsythia ovata]|uniref:LRR receptor-like serine/threonine-protein kinase n=1 Tax=Forsythia ovata TaxID=205694 RepID=A0ABD1VJY1_9LAMI
MFFTTPSGRSKAYKQINYQLGSFISECCFLFSNWPGTRNKTCTDDIYCFGKVLLELVTGKLGISASSDATLKDWFQRTVLHISIYDKEPLINILDPSLIIDEDLLEEVWAMAIIAKSCLNPNPSRRPIIQYVLKALENPLKVIRE